jgi:hypothetical protein
MTRILVASFTEPDHLIAGIDRARAEGGTPIDAFTPFPVEGLGKALGASGRRVRKFMLIGGLAAAALTYGMEYFSAVAAYPFDAGGRPLHSWPVFLLVPFEIGVLVAAACGLVALFLSTGLPRLNHPLFEAPGFEKASQDRFLLALRMPETAATRAAIEAALGEAGAERIAEAES